MILTEKSKNRIISLGKNNFSRKTKLGAMILDLVIY